MDAGLPNEAMIRQYLLGRVDATSKVAEEFQERLLADDDLAEWAELIEGEILEEYLEGTLSPSDRQAVETHFLRPPERQEKLRRMRLLQHHLETAHTPARKIPSHSFLKQYAGAAAGLLAACAAVVWALVLRHGMQIELARSRQELTQQQQHSAILEKQMQDLRGVKQPSVMLLTLLQWGVLRDVAPHAELEIGAGTGKVHVEILLPNEFDSSSCDIRLERKENTGETEFVGPTIWRLDRVEPNVSSASKVVFVDVPANAIRTGIYRFVVTQKDRPIAYVFQAQIQ